MNASRAELANRFSPDASVAPRRMHQGYANIGVIVNLSNQTNPYTYLGER
jgi:hypothetical protein